MTTSKNSSKKTSATDTESYEKLGKMLVELRDSDVYPGKGYYKAAFLKGVVGGFGGVIGATLLIAVLLWGLSFFTTVPILGRFVQNIQHSLQTNK